MNPRLLRTKAAARYLSVGEKYIRELILNGELPYVPRKAANSPFLIDVEDLNRWIQAHKTRA